MMHASAPFRTLCEAFQHTVTVDPEAAALRTPGGGQSLTWREYAERVRQIAGGLATLGLARGETLALMLTNRPEFNLIDTAAMHLGVIPYSIYSTCSVPQVRYLLTNAESRVAVCERHFLDKVCAAGGPVRHIVAVDGQAEGTISLRDLESRTDGGFDFDASWRAVQPSDLLTLIYTSGTTGDPKGVELTHANVLAEAAMVIQMYGVRHGDRHISYLPAAHIADRMSAHYVQLVYGTQLTTLSDPDGLGAALREVEPDYIFAVPRVWEKFKNALDASIAGAQSPQAQAIGRAMELGYRRVRARQAGQRLDPAEEAEFARLDQAVLAHIRASIGAGRLRWALSGAAPIATETLEFFMALGIRICEIWGLSECAGAATGNPLDRVKVGTVGVPLPGLELKVENDGELLIRGATVMRGYHHDPERTREVLTDDGWLRTGDVGTVDEDGYCTIIDRKKELIINAAGKNMSPSNIENSITLHCPLLAAAVAIGDRRPYNTALFVLDPDAAAIFAAKAGLRDASAAELANSPPLVSVIRDGVAEANAKLSRVEQVKRFRILPAYWEPGGDEITPTLKLKRKSIVQKYASEIEELYASPLAPHVHEPSAAPAPFP